MLIAGLWVCLCVVVGKLISVGVGFLLVARSVLYVDLQLQLQVVFRVAGERQATFCVRGDRAGPFGLLGSELLVCGVLGLRPRSAPRLKPWEAWCRLRVPGLLWWQLCKQL